MKFLDDQLEKKMEYVATLTPQEMPLLLLIDNVNIYRGNKRHHRLFKAYDNNMWNFTVRGLLVPHLGEYTTFYLQKRLQLKVSMMF